jgi:hypothetical protein
MIRIILRESVSLLAVLFERVVCHPCHLVIQICCLTLIRIHHLVMMMMMSGLIRQFFGLNLSHPTPANHVVRVCTGHC